MILHGFQSDHRAMSGSLEPVFRKVPGFKRIYIDLPAMGKSNKISGIKSSYDILKITQALVQKLTQKQPFYIIGQSYGGYLAQCLAKILKNIRGIFLIAPLVVPNPKKRDLNKHKVVVNKFKPKYFASNDEKEVFQILVVRTRRVWNDVKKFIVPGLGAANRKLLERIFETSYRIPTDIMKFKKRFNGHAHFILGRQDTVVGYRDALNVLENYPKASVNIISPAGHNLQYEQPVLFRANVGVYLNKIKGIL